MEFNELSNNFEFKGKKNNKLTPVPRVVAVMSSDNVNYSRLVSNVVGWPSNLHGFPNNDDISDRTCLTLTIEMSGLKYEDRSFFLFKLSIFSKNIRNARLK